jgi:hypothetical protein
MPRLNSTILQRLIKRATEDKTTGCWVWQGFKSGGKWGGYAMIKINWKNQLVSRICFEIFNRPLLEKEVVMHICDNPSCVNPMHLIAGSQGDNLRDAYKKNRRPVTKRSKLFKFKGKELHIAEIARQGGVCPIALRYQLIKQNLSAEMAVKKLRGQS